jgi:hypothetical protein
MYFALSPGSNGTGPDRFVASIPFVLSPGSALQLSEDPTCHIDGGEELKIEKLEERYLASIGPYTSMLDAERGLQRLTAALLWSSLKLNVGVRYSSAPGLVNLYDIPIAIPTTEPMAYIGRVTGWCEIDGDYDADQSVIRPENKRLVRFEGGHATLTVGIASHNFFNKLSEALRFSNPAAVVESSKLRLAIEICAGHRFELSANTQFLVLVTALEALLPVTSIASSAIQALNVAHSTVLEERKKYPSNSQGWSEITHLLSRLGKLQHESIGASMRRYTSALVQRHPNLGAPDITSIALRDAYSARSRLLHDGRVDPALLTQHLEFLRDFVPRLLCVLFSETANG